jgi:hypothetical protein
MKAGRKASWQPTLCLHAKAGLRIRDVYPRSRIPDPNNAPKEERNFFCQIIFCSHKYHSFIFEQAKNLF